MIARHSRRNRGMNGSPATALIADYIAAHPTCKPATWAAAQVQDGIPTNEIPAAQVLPTRPVLLPGLRPALTAGGAR